VTTLAPLMSLLEDVPDPCRAEGKHYKLPHVLLFSILAIVSGCNSYRKRRLGAAYRPGPCYGRLPVLERELVST